MNPQNILQLVRAVPERKDLAWFLASYACSIEGLDPLERDALQVGLNFRVHGFEGSVESICLHGYCEGKLLRSFWELKRAKEQRVIEQFYRTNIGREVWSTLDWCLEERRPCFIEGLEGRGKSASAFAWFDAHRGQARYVSLPGFGGQRDFFQAIAQAYGVAYSSAKAPNEIRWRVRDAIIRSGLVLIIDEAHHALPARSRLGSPALIDWIDTELCNQGVAVALISTPQFGQRLAEFAERTKWNVGQFRRRFAGRWCNLPTATAEEDLQKLAEHALPDVGRKGIKLAVGYAGALGRDVSALFDLVHDACRRTQKAGRTKVTFDDLRQAYELDRLPSENAMADAFTRPVLGRPSRKSSDFSSQDSEPSSPPEGELKTGFNRLERPLQAIGSTTAAELQSA